MNSLSRRGAVQCVSVLCTDDTCLSAARKVYHPYLSLTIVNLTVVYFPIDCIIGLIDSKHANIDSVVDW